MTDVRQSPQFANFMKNLGWKIDKIDHSYIYLKKFPLIGYFAKIPRPLPPFNLKKIKLFKRQKNIFKLKIAPFVKTDNNQLPQYQRLFSNIGFKIDKLPFNPTSTILIDLTQSEKNIFDNFSQAKRRAVRRALKNSILVQESSDIESFIKIRNKQYFPLGLLMTGEMKKLWNNFYPKNATLLLAYNAPPNQELSHFHAIAEKRDNPLAGILILFYERIAYYWHASALKEGKKLFAPTLLVWEALKLAKKRGCKIFDFEGIYDERFPKFSQNWKGFTKFKEGFGGKKVEYMENFTS